MSWLFSFQKCWVQCPFLSNDAEELSPQFLCEDRTKCLILREEIRPTRSARGQRKRMAKERAFVVHEENESEETDVEARRVQRNIITCNPCLHHLIAFPARGSQGKHPKK